MGFLNATLQKILKAEELNRIYYELGPMAECSQCKDEQLFSYITYTCENDSRKQKKDRENIRLQCSSCFTEIPIKCDPKTDKVIKSKVLFLYLKFTFMFAIQIVELCIWEIF